MTNSLDDLLRPDLRIYTFSHSVWLDVLGQRYDWFQNNDTTRGTTSFEKIHLSQNIHPYPMIGSKKVIHFSTKDFCLKLSIIHHMFLMFSIPPGLPQRPSAFHISCPNVSRSPWRYMAFTTGFLTQGSTTFIICKEAAVCHKWAMINPGITLQWMHDVHLKRYISYIHVFVLKSVFFSNVFSCIISKDFELLKNSSWHSAIDGGSPASPSCWTHRWIGNSKTNRWKSDFAKRGQVGLHTPQQCMPSKTTGKET